MKSLRPAICLVLLLLICQVTVAQDKPDHKIKSYTSEDGKLFWNKELPMYLFIADNPQGNNLNKLESENQAQYANPLLFNLTTTSPSRMPIVFFFYFIFSEKKKNPVHRGRKH